MATLSKIVLSRIDHDGAANHRLRPDELHQRVRNVNRRLTVRSRGNVAQTANVAGLVIRCAMRFAERVEVWAERGKPLGKVAKDVDCDGVLALRESLKLTNNGGRCVLRGLRVVCIVQWENREKRICEIVVKTLRQTLGGGKRVLLRAVSDKVGGGL